MWKVSRAVLRKVCRNVGQMAPLMLEHYSAIMLFVGSIISVMPGIHQTIGGSP